MADWLAAGGERKMEGLPWCEMNEKGQTRRRPASAESTERKLVVPAVGRSRAEASLLCGYFGEASQLWQVSNDAKHVISGILSRIRKGSLSITKDMIVGILPLFWLGDKKKKKKERKMSNTGSTGEGNKRDVKKRP